MMNYDEHQNYFEIAYKTGTDLWTYISLKARGSKFIEKLESGAMILDIGSGRGLFSKELADMGFLVIGIDFEKNIVKKSNENVKSWGLEGKLKYVEADVLDIPFTDNSFDGICNFGVLENLYEEDWPLYASEIARVLKSGGFYFDVSLSKETKKFFDFYPKGSKSGEFKKYKVHYHFFDKDEIINIFQNTLKPVSQEIEQIRTPNDLALVETLFQKI